MQALLAMFPEPGTVSLSVSELDALRFARVLLEGGCSSCSVADAVPISGAIRQVGMCMPARLAIAYEVQS